jgi:hypothetical protein
MIDRFKEMTDLCISHKLPLTILKTECQETKLITFITYKVLHSKTAGIIVEGKIIDRGTYKLTPESIYLSEEEFIGASLGFELAEG